MGTARLRIEYEQTTATFRRLRRVDGAAFCLSLFRLVLEPIPDFYMWSQLHVSQRTHFGS